MTSLAGKNTQKVSNTTTSTEETTSASEEQELMQAPTQQMPQADVMDSPNVKDLPTHVVESTYYNGVDSPKSAPVPESAEPFEWNKIWQETKTTSMWLIILSNVSLISYQLGKRNRTIRTPIRRNQNLRPLPSAGNLFQMQTMGRRPTTRPAAEDDGFNNVNLAGYEHYNSAARHYDSVASLPPPDPPTTRM